MSPPQQNSILSSPKIGFWTLTSLVFGNMVGSGIFLLPANLALIGSISLFAWLITACGAFLLALIFVKMNKMIPKSGGPYAYTLATFGDYVGFQTACNYWIQIWVGNAGSVLALIGYLTVFFPVLTNSTLTCVSAIGIIWLLTLINISGIRFSGNILLSTTIAKFIPIALICICGWWFFHPNYLSESFNIYSNSNFTSLSHAASLTLWGFIGLESATIPTNLVINPERNVPLATLVGTLTAALVYIVSSTVIMGMIPSTILAASSSPFAAAAQIIFGPWGKWLIGAGAVISCFGSLNGWILLQGQITLSAANDKVFPRIFCRLNKYNMPTAGLIIGSMLTSLLLLLTISPNIVTQFNLIVLLTVLASLIPYFYTVFAEILLLRDQKKTLGNVTHLCIAICAGVYVYWTIYGLGAKIIFYGSLLLFGIVPLFAVMRRPIPKR